MIAGAANNQLLSGEADGLLRDRGILYCPDYVVNAGGVLSVAPPGSQYDRASALHWVAGIEKTTIEVLERARKLDQPTGLSADGLARERLLAAAGLAAGSAHA